MELRGARVVLRPVSAGDHPLLRRWAGDRELRRLAGRRFGPPSTLGAEGSAAEFLILLREGRRPIGLCGLYGISPGEPSAEVGILLGERDTWGQGYGPEALQLLLGFAEAELGLKRLSLCVQASNIRAVRAYAKVGFTIERRMTVGRWLFGRGVEVLVMSCPLAAGVRAR